MKSLLAILVLTAMSHEIAAAASPTGWDGTLVPRGDYRDQIQATPIPQRPGRPGHLYGNTIRIFDQRSDTPVLYRPMRRFLMGSDQPLLETR